MVVVENFSVRIVNAEDKEPFKEHSGPGGKGFAEVEPELEFFIEVQVTGGDPNAVYYCRFSVDGTRLNYCKPMTIRDGKYHAGIWSREGGVDKQRAFKLRRPTFSKAGESVSRGGLMGFVEVDISVATVAGTYTPVTDVAETSIEPAKVSAGLSHGQNKKVLRSGEGSLSIAGKAIAHTTLTSYAAGEHLHTITIHYCTALGLVQAGVLSKPRDMWEEARMANPSKPASNRNAEDVKPERTQRDGVTVDGIKVEAPKECDMYDLSALSDEDDDDA